jgi:hypothetical protein
MRRNLQLAVALVAAALTLGGWTGARADPAQTGWGAQQPTTKQDAPTNPPPASLTPLQNNPFGASQSPLNAASPVNGTYPPLGCHVFENTQQGWVVVIWNPSLTYPLPVNSQLQITTDLTGETTLPTYTVTAPIPVTPPGAPAVTSLVTPPSFSMSPIAAQPYYTMIQIHAPTTRPEHGGTISWPMGCTATITVMGAH